MNHRVYVKLCGITNQRYANMAIACGVNALGFIFYRSSPRYIAPTEASGIIAALPPFIHSVGVFVNHSVADIHAIARQARIDLVQLHGDEQPRLADDLQMPFIRALRVRDRISLDDQIEKWSATKARGLLLDSGSGEGKKRYGGTGQTFDWSLIPAYSPKPIILSGGLNADNIAHALRTCQPWAVDINSGVESAPGVKNKALLAQLMRNLETKEVLR